MSSSILRQLWAVIGETQVSTLLKLSDTDLVKQLMKQLNSKTPLSGEESSTVSAYLSARTLLIRDLAQAGF
jgi:transcriptional regulator of NAD metabolism